MEKMLIIVARSKDNPDKVPSSAVAADSTGRSHLGQ
jgi:hypothetical protein